MRGVDFAGSMCYSWSIHLRPLRIPGASGSYALSLRIACLLSSYALRRRREIDYSASFSEVMKWL